MRNEPSTQLDDEQLAIVSKKAILTSTSALSLFFVSLSVRLHHCNLELS